MICIYHRSDFDGLSSAYIVKKKFPKCKMIGWTYGDPIPEFPDKTEEVIMVDITFPMEKMLELTTMLGDKFTVIDHHKSFIEEYTARTKDYPVKATTVLQLGRGACVLTWEHFRPKEVIPKWIDLISKYDVYDMSDGYWGHQTVPFQYGMRAKYNNLKDLLKFSGNTAPRIRDGWVVQAYVTTNNIRVCNMNSFVMQFEGFSTLCLNAPDVETIVFDGIFNPFLHDLMLGFNFTGTHWKVSLRSNDSTKCDCSVIAKKYGGGGHPNAAGFEVYDNDIIVSWAKIKTA